MEKFPSFYCARILEYAKANREDIHRRSEHVTDGGGLLIFEPCEEKMLYLSALFNFIL